jgi:hypothetical protein
MFPMALSRSIRSRDAEGFMFAVTSDVTLFLPNFEAKFGCSYVELSAEGPSGKPW